MKLNKLFRDDDAVSPVIGVILMVAITVILAAVIGAFVLNLGGGQKAAPQASFEYTLSSGTGEVSHTGGDDLDTANIKIEYPGGTFGSGGTFTPGGGDTTWSAGEAVSFSSSAGDVQVIWNNPESDKSNVIGEGTF